MSEIDWAALQKEAKDTLLPDGDYVAIVTKAESTKASTGKPMIKLTLTIADGPKRDRRLFTQMVLAPDSPFALARWFANLACFGLDEAYFGTGPSLDQIAIDLANRGVIATVGHREWQGSDRNEVTGFRPFAPSGPVPPGMVLGPVGGTGPRVAGPVTATAGPAPSTAPTIGPAPTVGAPSTPPPARPF